MKYFALTLTTRSPLAIRSDHAQEGAETLRHITGTTLAGSLATVHRLLRPDHRDEFEQFFLKGQVRYPDLYPAQFKSLTIQNENELPVYPLPKTAQSCKRFSGFKGLVEDEQEDDKPRHGARDTLFDWATFCLADRLKSPVTPATLLGILYKHKKCEKCQNAMDTFSGYYRRDSPQDETTGNMIYAFSKTRLQTHSGIDPATGTVQEGILYNRHVFNENSRFWGLIKVTEELEAAFKQFMKEVGNSGLVRVGTARSRGWGKVHFHLDALDDEQKRFDEFQGRLSTFDDTFRQAIPAEIKAEINKDKDLELDRFYFALTLHSPAILRDHLLRYRGTIDATVLQELLQAPADTTFRQIHHVASTRRVTGWNDMWGMPRTNEFAIDTGSVFLFSSRLKQQALEQALFTLEQEGIGERTSEGFGRVCVSDPFHQEVALK